MMVSIRWILVMDQIFFVSHIVSLSFAFPNRTFYLSKTLCVPIIKFFISLHHFTKHNNVYFEFHLSHFLVKDQIIKVTLLKSDCEDDVYRFLE